jgi:hypothetical protein
VLVALLLKMYPKEQTSLEPLVEDEKSLGNETLAEEKMDENSLDGKIPDRYDWVESSVLRDIGIDFSRTFCLSEKGSDLDIRRFTQGKILNLSRKQEAEDVDTIYVRTNSSYVSILLIVKEFE